MALLPRLEQDAPAGASSFMLPLLESKAFDLKLRTLIALKRMRNPADAPLLAAFLARERQTHFRLAALEALTLGQSPEATELLAPFLADGESVFLRGVVWCMGQLGPAALPALASFILQPYAGKVRSEVVTEALFYAAGQSSERLRAYAVGHPGLGRYLLGRKMPEKPLPKYDVYPYPDYLWQKAKAAGVDQKSFRRLYFYYRENGRL